MATSAPGPKGYGPFGPEKAQDMADAAVGLMQTWEYRAKWYGEREEVARAMTAERGGRRSPALDAP